jgi:aspartyl-tRNA(Asn)/glutamyl-tRNA(Gln) amidotransferase subunit C
MSIDKTIATKVAKLARISLGEGEAEYYAGEMSKILDWMEQLQQVNTDNVPQTNSVFEMQMPMRADAVTDGGYPELVVKNATAAQYNCFAVPKVIE